MLHKLQHNFDIIEFLFKNASPEQLTWCKNKTSGSLAQIICHLPELEATWLNLSLHPLVPTYYNHPCLTPAACQAAFTEFTRYRRHLMALLQTVNAGQDQTAGQPEWPAQLKVRELVEKIDQHDQLHINQIEAIIREMPLNPLLARALREIEDYHRRYQRYLIEATSVLDIGVGTGLALRHVMQQNPHLTAAGIDLRDLRLPGVKVPLQLYAGHRLPFETAQFEVSLLFYVLHHCQNPTHLLAETARVTRRHLIIIEEFDRPGADKMSLDLTERQNHRALGLPADLPYHLLDQTELEAMFRQFHLTELERQLLPSETARRVQKYLYILSCNCV